MIKNDTEKPRYYRGRVTTALLVSELLKALKKILFPPPLPLYCAPFMMSETSTKIVTLKPECGSHLI